MEGVYVDSPASRLGLRMSSNSFKQVKSTYLCSHFFFEIHSNWSLKCVGLHACMLSSESPKSSPAGELNGLFRKFYSRCQAASFLQIHLTSVTLNRSPPKNNLKNISPSGSAVRGLTGHDWSLLTSAAPWVCESVQSGNQILWIPLQV